MVRVTPPANSQRIVELIEGFRRSKALFAAVSLGVFDGKRPEGAEIGRLLDACVALGLLEKAAGEYMNTPVADEYLRESSPTSLAAYIRYSDRALYKLWDQLEQRVLEGAGRPDGPGVDNKGRTWVRENRRDFMLGMHGTGVLSSPAVVDAFDLSSFRRLVDLGGATGHLAAAARQRYPHLRVAVFDFAGVGELDRPEGSRDVEFVAGDFWRDPLPKADIFTLGRVLHNMTRDQCVRLLRRVYDALPGGGAILIAEKLLDDDRRGPASVHLQNLNMLVCTGGRERTSAEYEALLCAARFEDVQAARTTAPLDALFARKTFRRSS